MNVSIESDTIITIVKKKRGRPRKYPIVDKKDKVKKKRGRPKGKKNKNVKEKTKTIKTRGRPKNTIKTNKLNKVYSVTSNIHKIESNNVIIHLPIKVEDLNKQTRNLFNYNPTMDIPKACNEEDYNNYETIIEHDKKISTLSSNKDVCDKKVVVSSNDSNNKTDTVIPICNGDTESCNGDTESCNNCTKNKSYYKDYNYNIIHKNNWHKDRPNDSKTYIERLKEYKLLRNKTIKSNTNNYSEILLKEFSNINEWPEQTNISCWWCCHSFDSIPCSIPEKQLDKTFIVYGIFCSPECCSSYLFNDSSNNTTNKDISKKYSLLNLMYKDIYMGSNIEQSYPRETLKKFGGPLTIEEFRNNNNLDKTYKIVMPNINIITPKLELLDNIKSYSSNKFIINNNSNKNTVNKTIYKQESKQDSKISKSLSNNDNTLVLKRSTPFRKYNNTLEKCMNLKIKS